LACSGHTPAFALKRALRCGRWRSSVFTLARSRLPCRFHEFGAAHQPSLRSQRTMMTYANSLLSRREAGSLINRTVTMRTKPRFRHPRTGGTAMLLSTTTELLVIDLIAQHDPQANAQLAGHRHAGFPQPLLH
jgi:hypothetical protein